MWILLSTKRSNTLSVTTSTRSWWKLIVLVATAASANFPVSAADELASADNDNSSQSKPKCGVYLAPSTIPGAGLGMYAGDKHYHVQDMVTFGDVVIPIFEYDWHITGGEFEETPFLWDEYTWNSHVFPGMEEEGEDGSSIMAASPGIGAAANSYLTLVNIEDSYIQMGRGIRPNSPGVGAHSPYYGREFYAIEEIPPGGEIFVDYGENYFKSRKRVYGYLPLPDTYDKTDKLLQRYLDIKSNVENRQGALPTEVWADYYSVVKGMASIFEISRVLNGLPDSEPLIPIILDEGGTSKQHHNRSIREISWLEEHGQCMDNIKLGTSTNPDAGRGAFANRFIPKGGLVAPAPLIHVPNFNSFKMFRPKEVSEIRKILPDRDGPTMFQLLLNYCFGHDESTLLLCPYGLLTGYINHSADKPNARIQWSQNMRHRDWLERPFSEWVGEFHTGLQIDFIALRDIEEDEEIFIDYGTSWEEAWQRHVQEFVPRENYTPAFELNEMDHVDYKTTDEQEYLNAGVYLMCRSWYIEQFVPDIHNDVECRILKNLGEDRYLVQLLEVVFVDDTYSEVREGKVLWNVPSDAFFFEDLPYTRDHFQLNAFRHAMMIPDDMFPDVWKTSSQ